MRGARRRESGSMQYRPPTGSIPDAPGSYQFHDAEGRVLYVGKAKSLRHRLPNYWQDSAKLPPRTAQMVAQADHVEWVVVDSEVDALILEHSLIQAHLPRYNVRLKDDKSYPWLAVTLNEEWPRPAVVRGRKRKGVRYFGPYGHAGRHPRDARPAGAQLPGPHVLGHQVQAARAPRAALPALRHRALLGPVRRRRRPRGATTATSRTSWVPLGRHRAGAGPARGRDAGGLRRARSSSGRRACATASPRCARRPRPSRWSRTGRRTSTWSASPRTRSRRRSRSSTSAGAGWSGTAASWPRRSRTSPAPSSWRLVVAQVYGGRRGRGARGGSSCPRSPADLRPLAELAARPCRGGPGRRSRCPSGAPSGPCRRR